MVDSAFALFAGHVFYSLCYTTRERSSTFPQHHAHAHTDRTHIAHRTRIHTHTQTRRHSHGNGDEKTTARGKIRGRKTENEAAQCRCPCLPSHEKAASPPPTLRYHCCPCVGGCHRHRLWRYRRGTPGNTKPQKKKAEDGAKSNTREGACASTWRGGGHGHAHTHTPHVPPPHTHTTYKSWMPSLSLLKPTS